MNPLSSYLFARPSFLGGMASVLDIGGSLQDYNFGLTPEQADGLAALADWSAVGADLRGALREYLLPRLAELEDEPV